MSSGRFWLRKYTGNVRLGHELNRVPGIVTKIKLRDIPLRFIEDDLLNKIEDNDSVEFVDQTTTDGDKLLAVFKVISQSKIREIEISSCNFDFDEVISIDDIPNLDSIRSFSICRSNLSSEALESVMNIVEKCNMLQTLIICQVTFDGINFRRLKEVIDKCKNLRHVGLVEIYTPFDEAIDARNRVSQMQHLPLRSYNHDAIVFVDVPKQWPTADEERTELHEFVEVLCNTRYTKIYTNPKFPILPLCYDYLSSINMIDDRIDRYFQEAKFHHIDNPVIFKNGYRG